MTRRLSISGITVDLIFKKNTDGLFPNIYQKPGIVRMKSFLSNSWRTNSVAPIPHYLGISDMGFDMPIIEWTDEKTLILSTFVPEFPRVMENYHELFVGGGSVLLAALFYMNRNKISILGKVYAYDINEGLIFMYNNIKFNHKLLQQELDYIFMEYNSAISNSMAAAYDSKQFSIRRGTRKNMRNNDGIFADNIMQFREKYYYWKRHIYNNMTTRDKNSHKGSALFIFMNKTCFRGIFREGPNGFNTPYGYRNAVNVDKHHMARVSQSIQNVTFICCDFAIPLLNGTIKGGDFVYIDPPRFPDIDSVFYSTIRSDFGIDKYKLLCNICESMIENNISMMLTSSDVLFIREHFQIFDYCITVIEYNKEINSKLYNENIKEVMIKNYNYIR